jgi:hypothetical protein
MTARDAIHDAVRNALEKDGWTITADPYTIEYEDVRLYADLAADRPLAAERADRKIVVEVKSFLGPSPVHDLELAIGQYHLYRSLLDLTAPERGLYLAIAEPVYVNFFSRAAVRVVINRLSIPLLVVDLEKQEVVKWTS